MPKEKKSRGRRQEKKSKSKSQVEEVFEDDGIDLKVYNDAADYEQDEQDEKDQQEPEDEEASGVERPAFFGIVDRQELEYFKQAESTLAVDGFGSSAEREGFISGVIEEAKGKELKLVTNQICSKLVERLILLANEEQLKGIFEAFQGRFLQLSKHKYSSHCVETLLVRSAALVEKEMLAPPQETMEDKMIKMVDEMKVELMVIPSDPYASHVLRLILLILSGSPLPSTTQTSKLRSKKSKIARKMISIKDNDDFEKAYQIPESFKKSLSSILEQFNNELDTNKARQLAIHKVSSPVIQLLIQVESSTSSEKKKKKGALEFTNKIFNKDDKEEAFIEHLLSDPVGSHFLEAAVNWMPLKQCERIYQQYVQSRTGRIAKRESGNFVIQALLKRLRTNEVKEILDVVVPLIPELLEYNTVLVRAAIDAAAQHEYKQQDITDTMLTCYKVDENNKSEFLENMLQLKTSTLGNTRGDWPTAEEMHRSLLLQSLVKASDKFLSFTLDAFIDMDQERLLLISRHSVFSHCLEVCLRPNANIIQRRKMLNQLSGVFAELSCNAYGSHLVDKAWRFCYKLKHFRERIAEELVAETDKVKNSIYGRVVWRNWNLDKYVRKKFEWWKIVKEQEDEISEQLGAPVHPTSAAQVNKSRVSKPSGAANSRFQPYNKPNGTKRN